jgi:toxin YxiD
MMRTMADKMNQFLHRTYEVFTGKQIHEIHPVKFGGDPLDLLNKKALDPALHRQVSAWWKKLQNAIEPYAH